MYISPLKYIIEQTPNMKYHIYADDIQNYSESCHHDTLMLCVNNIRKWLLNINLLIHCSTTMLLNICLSNFVFPEIIFDNILIIPSSKIKFLGIFVSCNVSQSGHVSYIYIYIYKSANYHLHNINIIRKYLSIKSTIRLIESLVLSRLDYGNIIFIGAPIYIYIKKH